MGPKGKINRLSNNSLGILSVRIINCIDASTVVEVKTADFYNDCVQACERYKAANTRQEKSKFETIDIEFGNRKQILAEMQKYLQGLTISPDAAMKAAAGRLFAEVIRFGNGFAKGKNADQSYKYKQIIMGLKKPELLADLEALKLVDKLQQLETAHITYENLYMQWGDFKNTAITATKLRSELTVALKSLLDEIDWLQRKNSSVELTDLRNSIYARIDEMNLSRTNKIVSKASQPDNTNAA